ncbi:MAG: NAD-dependent epimerase/dehydratase family protein [Candidatus Lokiarchaeota archaeon]|nr:NAD-dependent epimerase/dehydratase family protein [Candidatus Lokiarchaeota archaeon]
MRILLTGAFGIVGMAVLDKLIERNFEVRIFEVKNLNNWMTSLGYRKNTEIFWGDIRNKEDVKNAVKEIDVVIHLAAIIPPLADKNPDLANSVNYGGTINLIKAMEQEPSTPKLIFTSSIAVYGDRRDNPYIKKTDEPNPNKNDHYARQKLQCEQEIKNSDLEWAIFRLTYIVSPRKIKMDPIMFEMPLDTSIEVCTAKDTALALVNAIGVEEIWGNTFHIAGGKKCRTTYKEYLNRMFEIFGIDFKNFPDEAFAKKDFHCGFLDTDESQKLLQYQKHTLEDYYEDIEEEIGILYYFYKLTKNLAQKHLLHQSKYLDE